MKEIFTLISLFFTTVSFSQSIYTASDYALANDTFYITAAQLLTTNNFDTTGNNITWDYSSLTGASQQQLVFRDPKSTGITQLQWPYIYNSNNVNLSSTNNQTITVGNLQETNANAYFLKAASSLSQKASSYNISYAGLSLNVKNTYTSPDTLYKFPLNYADTFASNASYVTTFPGLYYITQTINRTNKVDGWGTVITPHGTYSHCLRVRSYVTEADSFSIAGTGIPSIVTQYQELKWLDTSTGYPVLLVRQTKTGNAYTTSLIQYIDKKQLFQPVALFAYVPLSPQVNDTVTFQNLSLNSASYLWSFGDGDISHAINPQHVYTADGVYPVTLIAYNDSLSDTITLNITVNAVLAIKLISFSGSNHGSYNTVTWGIAQTGNKAIYNLQRSSDGNAFSTVYSVAATSDNNVANYNYKDDARGGNYYRLQMVDEDGAITYSNVILISFNTQQTSINLNPVPVKRGSNITAAINSAISGNSVLYIVNSDGKIVYNKAVNLIGGSNQFIIPTLNFASGIYYVTMKGAVNLTSKFLIE